ncbi:NYN domain-containing protein [Rubneribacter sp.]
MDTKASSENRFALLIDADNVSAKYIKPITDELSKYGTVTIKRIYGDWTLTLHAKWKDTLLENSITPIQQFGYTQGKNATDSAMIIDAMDILYGGSVDGFCIVSSDSDFTRLASRLRESGLTVIGMGEKKTPTAFRKACDIFTTLELLLKGTGGRPGNGHDRGHGGAGPSIKDVEQAVVSIVTDNLNNGKATGLGEVGSRLLKRYPDFDVRSYGTNQLKKLLGEFPGVVVTKEGNSVTVELAEDKAQPQAPAADQPAAPEQPAASAVAPERPAESASDPEPAQAQEAGEAPAEQRKPKSRRGGRGGQAARRKKASAEAKEEAPSQADPAAAPEQPAASNQPAAASEQPAAPDQPAAAAEPKPEAAPAESAAPKRKPRRKPAKPKAQEREKAAAKPAAAPEPAASPESESERPGTPEQFIRQLVREAGAEGVALSELGKRVRARFRTFKLRDLGYTQLRSYVADLDDVEIEKRGKDFFARLGE